MSWPITKLGQLAEFKNGLNFSKSAWGKGLKIIGVSDFKDRIFPDYSLLDEINPAGVVREADYLDEGDFLFVRSNGNRDLIGRSIFIENLKEQVSHSGFTIRARFTSSEVYRRFFIYVFRSSLIRTILTAYGGGTNINNLNQGILSKLDVPLPALPIQRKIAAILTAYDELIETNKRRIAVLEKMAEELYREWFVRMRFPGHQNTKIVKGVPEGWEVTPLSDLGTFLNGFAFKPSHWGSEGIPIIKIKEMNAGVTGETPRNPGDDIPSKYHFDDGAIIFSWSGSLGVMIWDQGPGLLNQHLFKVEPKKGNPHSFLFLALSFSIPLFEVLTTGATMQHIKRKELSFVKVKTPPPHLLKEFSDLVDPILESKIQLTRANRTLTQTRDLLLPRLISGKLSVEGLDIQFPPSMREEAIKPKHAHA